jgi:hypothetical protein
MGQLQDAVLVADYFISNMGAFGKLGLSETACVNDSWIELE